MALFCIVLLTYCNKDDDEISCDPMDSERFSYGDFPLDKLSDYGFFTGNMFDQIPESDIVPYTVITPLFSDYAHKKRFIYMPDGQTATFNGDHEVLDMPDGTIIIKTFYYDNVMPDLTTKLMETRLLYKINGFWNFADYVWNETQEEAYFELDGANQTIQFENDNGELISVDYRVPSETECKICHKLLNESFPIGPKPQNLNTQFVYDDEELNQLAKWAELGFINEEDIPLEINTVADWEDDSFPIKDRVRAYIDMNCAHCHRGESHCSYRDMRFAWNETDIDENLGLCLEIAEPIDPNQLFVVAPGNANKSMLYFRINSVEESERMPLLGRSIIHEEGVQLIEEWINNSVQICN